MLKRGKILTFYSYKGGTGRSMALCNVACILATRQNAGESVLLIDWDLEAPGLHRYFQKYLFSYSQDPVKAEHQSNEHPGLIDLFYDIQLATNNLRGKRQKSDGRVLNDIIEGFPLEKYVIETEVPGISILKAGRLDGNYSARVNEFHWKVFFRTATSLLSDLFRSCFSTILLYID